MKRVASAAERDILFFFYLILDFFPRSSRFELTLYGPVQCGIRRFGGVMSTTSVSVLEFTGVADWLGLGEICGSHGNQYWKKINRLQQNYSVNSSIQELVKSKQLNRCLD